MKKLNLIMPIIGLSTIITGLSITTSCSSDDAIHLTSYKLFETETKVKLLYKQVQSMKQGEYTVAVDMNGFWETDHRLSYIKYESYFSIRDTIGEAEPDKAGFNDIQIWYNNTKLEQVDKIDDLEANKYCLQTDALNLETYCQIFISEGTVKTGKEKVKIKLNLLEPIENYYLCFFGPEIV